MNLKYFIPSLALLALLVPGVVLATPTSWDFASGILQPLQSQWTALVKADHYQATSTTPSLFPYASTTALSGTYLCLSSDCRSVWPVGGVSSVSNSDLSLTFSPTVGAVVGSINTSHSNSWNTIQNFGAGINMVGTGFIYGSTAAGGTLTLESTNHTGGAAGSIIFDTTGDTEQARITSVGLGVGSTSPWKMLSVGTGNNGTFAISTSTAGCAQLSSRGELYSTGTSCGTTSGTVTSITAGTGLLGGTITTSGTFTNTLATSSVPVIAGLPYYTNTGATTGTALIGSVATGTISNGTGISVTAGQSVIGSGLTITNTGVTSIVAGTNISISGATGAVTVNSTASGNGNVATSTNELYSAIPYFNSTNGTPAKIASPSSGSIPLFYYSTSTTPTVSIGNPAGASTDDVGVLKLSHHGSVSGGYNIITTSNSNNGDFTFTIPNVTGTGALGSQTSGLAYWQGTTVLNKIATTSVTCSGSVSCSTFTAIGASPVTITATGGSGLSTTTPLSDSNLLVYSVIGAGSAYGVATSTLTASSPLTGSFTQIGTGGSLGCQNASGSQAGCLSSADWTTFNSKGSGSVTSITAGTGLLGGTITTSGTVTGTLATSSVPVIAGIPYFTNTGGTTGTALFGNVATTSVTCGTGTSCSSFTVIGASPITITASGGGSGLSTTTPIASSNVLVYSAVGAGAAYGIATTTHAFSGPFTVTGTIGTLIGGTNSTVTWSGLATTSNLTSGQLLYNTTGGNGVASVGTSTLTASSPLTGSFTQVGSGGSLGCQTASGSQTGCLSSTDWNTFNNKGSGTVTAVSVATANGFAGSSSGGATPALTLTTSQSGLLEGNGTAITGVTGTIGQFPYYSGTNLLTATSTLYLDTTSNLGIGSTTPGGKLSVFLGGDYLSRPNSTAFLVGSSTAGTATSTLFDVLSTGNVGVGTSTPGSLLSIGGTGWNFYDNGTTTDSGAGGINITAGCFATSGTCLQTFIQNATAYKSAAIYGTTGALSGTPTYNNGTSGVGATLTEVGTGALSVDGASPSVGQRILVKNEATQANNGVYTVTATGSGIASYILTRATDFNTSTDVYAGVTVPVLSGTANAGTAWTQTTTGVITIGTTAIVFTEASAAGGGVASITGTPNQVTASASTGAVTLSIPSLFLIQQASTTMFSTLGPLYIGKTSTTTISGEATSTFPSGINITGGGLSLGSTVAGFLKATAGAVATALVNLTTDVTGILPIANGGTASSTLTAYAVLLGGTTATGALQQVTGTGSSGNVLTSNGAGAVPSWQASAGGSTVTITTATSSVSGTNLYTGSISVLAGDKIAARAGAEKLGTNQSGTSCSNSSGIFGTLVIKQSTYAASSTLYSGGAATAAAGPACSSYLPGTYTATTTETVMFEYADTLGYDGANLTVEKVH